MDTIPTDLVVEILQRLPWTSRRRLRLVCRSWRDLVHQRTAEMQQRRDAVPLVVTTDSAYLLDGLGSSKACTPRELWPSGGGTDVYKRMEVVGACNGVLCLCDDGEPGGAITLANPATGDVLALPPIPRAGLFRRHNSRRSGRSWHQAYSFGYHHATGQYKVVHVPCFFKTKETMNVFTLGEASWKEVPAPGDCRCRLDAGVVSVNGATYWVVEGSERIVSFHHESEQVKTVTPLPVAARPIGHLTEVRRRLSVAVATTIDPNSPEYYGQGYGKIEVWVLESTRKEQAWIHQYNLLSLPTPGPSVQMARPNFIHGEYVLMVGGQGQRLMRYHQQPIDYYVTRPECSALQTSYCDPKASISNIKGDICRTFTYVKTTDALSIYKRW